MPAMCESIMIMDNAGDGLSDECRSMITGSMETLKTRPSQIIFTTNSALMCGDGAHAISPAKSGNE